MTTPTMSIDAPDRRPSPLVRKARSHRSRRGKDIFFVGFCMVAAALSVLLLFTLLGRIILQGIRYFDWQFITSSPSTLSAETSGIWPALWGTICICIVCLLTAVPIGVATAILLEEYPPKNRFIRKLHSFIQLNIANLAGVPSIVYGLLGLTVFVGMFGKFGSENAPAGEFGVTWYDRFVTPGGNGVQVKVGGPAQDMTDVQQIETFYDTDGKSVAVTLLTPEQFLEQSSAIDDRVNAFEDAFESAAKAATDRQGMLAAVRDAAKAAGFKADTAAYENEIAELMVAAKDNGGRRELRSAERQSKTMAERAEFSAVMPATLSTDNRPSRVSVQRPWYLRLPIGRSVLAGGLTLMLVVLPIVIIASQESLRAVSKAQRMASLALGATPWQTIWKTTLPIAIPGIMTGTILAMSRAIGEAAPVLIISGTVFITFTPESLMDRFTAMPLQIFQWAGMPGDDFRGVAAAGIILLLAVLLCFNAVAVYIRHRTQQNT